MYNGAMRKILLLSTAVLSVIGALTIYYFTDQNEEEHVHYHAGFRVYIDGKLQDYSDYKFMNFVPCSEHDTKKSAQEEQIELAHLHDGVGDVVHVHRSGARWGDLFKNIGVELPSDLPELTQSIVSDSSIVIMVGNAADKPEKVSIERIKEVEAKSELCASN